MGSYDAYIVDGSPLAALSAAIRAIAPPIGTIISWAKSITGVPTIPDGYLECDGSTISDADSPMNGQAVPNLNGNSDATSLFLRGSTASGGTGGEVTTGTHTHVMNNVNHISDGPDTSVWYSGLSTASGSHSNIPSYYEVVFIMRIK